MKDVYAGLCLLLGSTLVLAQVVAYFGAAKTSQRVKTTKAMALRTKAAAEQVSQAALAAAAACEHPNLQAMDEETQQAATQAATRARTAAATASDAASQADDVASASSSVEVLLDSLAGKLPLAVAGIVLIALGALIEGWITLSASAST